MVFRVRKAAVPKMKWVKSAIVVVAIVGAFLVLTPGKHPNTPYALVIYNQEEHLLFSVPVSSEEIVTLRYRHSSDGTPVVQIFQVGENATLDLLEEQYSWFGAGLEHGSGHRFTYEGDTVRVSGYDRKFSELFIRVARTVPQELEVGGEIFQLADLAPGGSRLLLKIEEK